jgi:MFS family permease
MRPVSISPRKLGLLSALYIVQGMPFGFQSTALPVYLREEGVSLKTIGFLSALALPWALKALWAPLVDRYGSARLGRRKSWILPMQAGLTVTCATAAFVPMSTGLPALLALVFLMNLFAATQDIAVDGLAVDLLTREELGLGNTAQVVGYKVGMMAGGGGLLAWLFGRISLQAIFLVMAGLSLAVFVVTALSREPPPSASGAERMRWGEVLGRLKAALLLPGAVWVLLFIGTYKLGETMSDVLYKPFLVDAGFSTEQILVWVGTWGTVASIAGSLVGGWAVSRMRLLDAVALTATLRLGPLVGRWALATWGATTPGVLGVTLAEEFFGGALTTAMFAFMMSRVDRRIGATHFTLLASAEVLGKVPGGGLAGVLAQDAGWSYARVFLLGILLSVAFLALLVPLRRHKPERSQGAVG